MCQLASLKISHYQSLLPSLPKPKSKGSSIGRRFKIIPIPLRGFRSLKALGRLRILALQPLIKCQIQYQTHLLIFLQRCHSKDFLWANLQNVNKYLWHEATRAGDVYEAVPRCLSSGGKKFLNYYCERFKVQKYHAYPNIWVSRSLGDHHKRQRIIYLTNVIDMAKCQQLFLQWTQEFMKMSWLTVFRRWCSKQKFITILF